MNKKKILILNIVVSLLSQIIILLMGFIVPKIVLTHYGSDTNGLINTIQQIFVYVALLEAGITTSAKNALYKPLNDKDQSGTSLVLSAARRYYRKIAFIYLTVVILLSFTVPIILKTSVNYWTVFLIVLFEGLVSVVTFYFISTWSVLLTTNGRSFIVNLIELISKVLCYTIKIILALNNFNYAIVELGFFLVSLIKLVLYYLYMHKKYNWVDYNAAPKDYKLPDRNSYIITEVAWTIFSSVDMVVLSIFISTSLSSVYSVYNLVFFSLSSILNALYFATTYRLGLTYHENLEEYKKIHNTYNSFFIGLATMFMCIAYILIIPFVKLYTSDVNDISYVYEYLPLLFCLVQLLSWSRYISGNITAIGGYAKSLSIVSIIEAGINLVLSVILVNFYGIYGVLIATCVALPLKVIFTHYIAEKKVMHRKPWRTLTILFGNYAIFACVVVFSRYLDLNITSYLQFILYGMIITAIALVAVFGLNILFNPRIFDMRKYLKRSNVCQKEEETIEQK